MIDNYYKRQIYPFVVNLVQNFVEENGYEKRINVSDLRDSDISTFASILLAESPEEISDIVWNDSVFMFVQMALRTKDTEDALIFAEKQLDNIIEYFEPKMFNILTDIHEHVISEYRDTAKWKE